MAREGGDMIWRSAAKTCFNDLSFPSIRFSNSSNRFASSLCVIANSRSRTKALTTATLAATAIGLFKTLASMIAPCSVKAMGGYR